MINRIGVKRSEMDIMFIVTALSYGGAENQVVEISARLSERGWETGILSITAPSAHIKKIRRAGVRLFSLNIRNKISGLKALPRLISLIQEWKPKIIHAHMVHANILARLVRLFVPIPVLICTAHNVDERGRRGSGWLRILLYRLTDPLCDLTTQVSQAGLRRYIRIGAVPKPKICYVPNGVDINRFCPDPKVRMRMRQDIGFGNDFVWLSIGRLVPQKDFPTMLQAFSSVVQRRLLARLIIVGDGPLKLQIEHLAQQLGISRHVVLLGVRDDVPELMNAADAFVMSSLFEGMPMALLEAHSTGLPVVATNVGGNGEVVLHAQSGYLVPPRDPESLACAMLRLMELPEEDLQRMREIARQNVISNFNIDSIVDKWIAIYNEFLAKSIKR